MAATIRIQMMDNFLFYIDEKKIDQLASKSKKGASLVQYLLLNEGQPVPNIRILHALWDEDKSTNPENALKTLVSRIRVILNQIDPRLGGCIVADRGAYHWECLPDMSVDMYELEEIFNRLADRTLTDDEKRILYRIMLDLYVGDLLQYCEQNEWALAKATMLHNKYIVAVYDYIEMLKKAEDFAEIIAVCRRALDVDNFDDRIHMELMSALIRMNRTCEALGQYKHLVQLNYRYLGLSPNENLREFYDQIVTASETMDFNLNAIRDELMESRENRGAFVCDYSVFKEIFSLQMRNLERLGATIFLAIVMINPGENKVMDSLEQDNVMSGLQKILCANLRRGDTITRFAPTVFALLLPTVNYRTGNMVMERIRRVFYQNYASSDIMFNYRIGPLTNEDGSEKLPEPHEDKLPE